MGTDLVVSRREWRDGRHGGSDGRSGNGVRQGHVWGWERFLVGSCWGVTIRKAASTFWWCGRSVKEAKEKRGTRRQLRAEAYKMSPRGQSTPDAKPWLATRRLRIAPEAPNNGENTTRASRGASVAVPRRAGECRERDRVGQIMVGCISSRWAGTEQTSFPRLLGMEQAEKRTVCFLLIRTRVAWGIAHARSTANLTRQRHCTMSQQCSAELVLSEPTGTTETCQIGRDVVRRVARSSRESASASGVRICQRALKGTSA